jgi:hypothetical protein
MANNRNAGDQRIPLRRQPLLGLDGIAVDMNKSAADFRIVGGIVDIAGVDQMS